MHFFSPKNAFLPHFSAFEHTDFQTTSAKAAYVLNFSTLSFGTMSSFPSLPFRISGTAWIAPEASDAYLGGPERVGNSLDRMVTA